MKIRFSPLYILLVIGLCVLGQGAVAACSLLALLAHEGAHALVARRYGFKLDTVRLQPYGAQLDGDLNGVQPGEEIAIALAGPICSGLLAAVVAALWWCLPSVYEPTKAFALTNASLAVVNLLPVYPMDGGRVLFAALCKKKSAASAMKAVSIVGVAVGLTASALFSVGLLYGINWTLAVMAVFMLSSAVGGVRGSRYAAISACAVRERKRAAPVRMTAFPVSGRLIDALKLLDGRHYVLLVFVDASGAVVGSADESRLIAWSLGAPASTSVSALLPRRPKKPT